MFSPKSLIISPPPYHFLSPLFNSPTQIACIMLCCESPDMPTHPSRHSKHCSGATMARHSSHSPPLPLLPFLTPLHVNPTRHPHLHPQPIPHADSHPYATPVAVPLPLLFSSFHVSFLVPILLLLTSSSPPPPPPFLLLALTSLSRTGSSRSCLVSHATCATASYYSNNRSSR